MKAKNVVLVLILFTGLTVFESAAREKPERIHTVKDHENLKAVRYYLKVGLNFSNAHNLKPGLKENEFKTGFNTGIQADIKIQHPVYLQTGLFFTTKGLKFNTDKEKEAIINQMYLQVPFTLAFKFPVRKKDNFILNFGPYLAYGIAGKTDDGKAKKHDTFDKARLKRFDAGLLAGAGYEFDRILLALNYEHGLVDIAQTKKNTYKNQNITLSLGLRF